jgi:hypothetical protein
MWTYEKFVKELKIIGLTVPDVPKEPAKKEKKRYGYSSHLDGSFLYGGISLYSEDYTVEPWEKAPALVLSWTTGGIGGGSCWGWRKPRLFHWRDRTSMGRSGQDP